MTSKIDNLKIPPRAEKLPRDYEGYVFISDIDKTYLATHIDSLGGLLKAAFETPERKLNVPGVSLLLRAVRRGAGIESAANPLFFVSASPPQMERKILSKMELDGVEHDGIIFKNQLDHVRKGKFKKLREQIGYKLGALLSIWCALPSKSKIVLLGDDSESDALVFSLFAEVVAKNIEGKNLYDLLRHLHVFREEALKVAWLSRNVPAGRPVQAAFIKLETVSSPNYYGRLGSFIYPTENALQAAFALFEQGLIREQAVRSIGRDLVLHYDFDATKLLHSLEAGARRGVYGLDTLDRLWPLLYEAQVLPAPQKREQNEGALTRLNARRWTYDALKTNLSELKLRYSDEGRY